jgi:YD repeat-containing protein
MKEWPVRTAGSQYSRRADSGWPAVRWGLVLSLTLSSLLVSGVARASTAGPTSARGIRYAYDGAGRLTAVTTTLGTARYAYDAAGNIRSIRVGRASHTASRELRPVPHLAPIITGVNARVIDPGSTISVAGSGFDPSAREDDVAIGQEFGTVVSSTRTRLQVRIPTGPSFSGQLVVATPSGTARGPDVFVPPPGYSASQVGFVGRLDNAVASRVSLSAKLR